MIVKVTQEDIDFASSIELRSPLAKGYLCPIGAAMRRITGKNYYITPTSVFGPKFEQGSLPEDAQVFIKDFDKKIKVFPIEFELNLEEDHGIFKD